MKKLLPPCCGLAASSKAVEAACLCAVDKLLLKLLLVLLLWKLGVEAAKMVGKLKLQVQRNVAFTTVQAANAAINSS